MSKPKKHYAEQWQVNDWTKPNQKHVQVFWDVLDSDAFHDLSPTAVKLYLFCCRKAFDYKDKPQPNNKASFTLSRKEYTKDFRLYKASGSACFQRDMDRLIKVGLVDLLKSGYGTKTKNVYQMSTRWKEYKSPPPKEDKRKGYDPPKVRGNANRV